MRRPDEMRLDEPRQRRIVARAERAAVAQEVGVGAEHPVAALDAHRRRAIVEARVAEVVQRRRRFTVYERPEKFWPS